MPWMSRRSARRRPLSLRCPPLGDQPGSRSRPPQTRPTRLIALAVGIGVIVIASIIIRPLIASDETTTYRNDELGWTVTLPPGWEQIKPGSSVQPAPRDLGPVLAGNIFFANGPATVVDDQPISSVDGLEPPEGGVVILISPANPSSFVNEMVDDDDAYPPAPSLSPTDGPEDHAGAVFRVDGIHFSVGTLYGAGISEDDRNEANEITRSLAVPPAPASPPDGSATVRFPDQPDIQAWRLGPADRFPPGTVVEVSIEPLPGVEQPKTLFIVTPDQPINGSEHWMISGADQQCHRHPLTWDGTVFRCDGRSFTENGMPTDHRGYGLKQSSVVLTWEGQLITALNGAVSTF